MREGDNGEMSHHTYDRKAVTAPGGTRAKMNFHPRQTHAGQMYKPYKESDLLKAANVYSQFDKKGNFYENRLYAKTSINQAKLEKDQICYDLAMENYPDEEARINQNGSISEAMDNNSAL